MNIFRFNAPRTLAAFLALALAVPGAAAAQPDLTPSDLQAFFDHAMPALLRKGDIAGGVVTVVKDGRVVFAKGYGYADLAAKAPVTPQVLFRPGSITKLFTWTAVMQLVEQGQLDLDADVQTYLDFQLPRDFAQPITLRRLMTHTAGFEETSKDLFAASPSALYPLGDYLRRRRPERIYPPGEIVAYSNYGTALAGYIVQRVSGEPYDAYVSRHILQPLGMTHTTLRQPPAADLAAEVSKGYASAASAKAEPYELIEPAPAGAMATSADDMARFMIAHLQEGRGGDARILRPATMALMHARASSPAPGREGFTLGFFDQTRNGLRVLGHDGDTLWFHSDLHLIPSKDVGFYVSLNSAGNGVDVRRELFRAFMDRYFPYLPPPAVTPASAGRDAWRVAGWYETSRRNQTTLGLRRVFYQFRVTALPDGRITIPIWGDSQGRSKTWREVGPLTYRESGGQAELSFVADAKGRVRYFVNDDETPIELFQRVRGLQTKTAVYALVPLSAAVLGLGLLGPVVPDLRGGQPARLTARERALASLSRAAVAVQLLAAAGWPALMQVMGGDLQLRMSGGADPWMYGLYAASLAAVAGLVPMTLNLVSAWRRRYPSLRLLFETLMLAGGLYVAWFILTFRLASFSVRY
ncbi:MAG: beta-lactamase family protein [Caulobacterales bacterium]|nr:beta-lactamase family protein [Caulobacterales bacterium]